VGKSLISAILSQYLSSKGQDVSGIDADPVNQTFSEYQGLRVECLNLLKERSIDQREFDLLMERFLKEDGTFVVDTGATTLHSSVALHPGETKPPTICGRKGSACSSTR
jgi:CO dehydrogenase nickel-insertion accessory protein CooC1